MALNISINFVTFRATNFLKHATFKSVNKMTDLPTSSTLQIQIPFCNITPDS